MSRWFYSLMLRLLLPAAAVWFVWRGWRTPAHRGRLAQRLSIRLHARDDRPLWLHAASIGELRALIALLPHLDPGPLLITVGSPAGLARAREHFAQTAGVTVQAAPWDLPGAARRFVAATHPRAAIFIETELWPNLIRQAQRHAVPLTLLSGRVSARSLHRYRRFAPRLMRDTVCAFAAIGAQSATDRERFLQLGASPARVAITGNLKFDLPMDPQRAARGAALRARWAPQRWLWVAGSTHAGEEETVLDAHRGLIAARRSTTAPLLALAPRQPERFATVSRWLTAKGVRHARSSEGAASADDMDVDVLLVDELGVLPDWYAAADAAFVGGSLTPVGGHNLLEPAALARPVLTGPHCFNAPDVAHVLLQGGGARQVEDAAQLGAQLLQWCTNPAEARACGESAAATVAAHRGAAARAVALFRASVSSSPAGMWSAP